eukprot:826348_1
MLAQFSRVGTRTFPAHFVRCITNMAQSSQPYRSSKRPKRKNKRNNAQHAQNQSYHQEAHNQVNQSIQSSSTMPNQPLLSIDGSIMEGGGQILRNSITLSALTKRAIHITNIRGKRSNPGLRKQHSKGIELVANINRGYLEGNYVKSMDIKYYPSSDTTYLNTYTVDIETAGSVCLLIQTCLPLLLFSPFQCHVTCIGGTNASFAPQIDWYILILKPMLKRLMNINIDIQCTQRGFFPRGGGKVFLQTNPVDTCIPSFDLTKRGTVSKIHGRVVIGGKGMSVSVGEDVVRGAVRELQLTFGKRVKMEIDIIPKDKIDSYSDGIGVVLVAETDTGCLLGGSSLKGPSKGGGKRSRGKYKQNVATKMDYEEIGRVAARELATDWTSTKGGCTDRWLQDQLIIFMALAKGKSRMKTCALELHAKTAIYIAEMMTGVTFSVSQQKDGVLVECDGIGYVPKQQSKRGDDYKDNTRNEQNQSKSNDNDASYLSNRPSFI